MFDINEFSFGGEIANNLHVSLQSAYSKLTAASSSDNFLPTISAIFGGSGDLSRLQELTDAWVVGDFSQLPSIEILSSDLMNDASGAFSEMTRTIYLSSDYLSQDSSNPNSLTGVTGVLLEEIGHFMDTLINPGSDTAGDEGASFAATLMGLSLSNAEKHLIDREDDHGFVTIGNELIAVEQSLTLPTNTLKTLGSHADYEFLNRIIFKDTIGKYKTLDIDLTKPGNDGIKAPSGQIYKEIQYIHDPISGFQAAGFISESGAPPVLVFNGTNPDERLGKDILDDLNAAGIGTNQFSNNIAEIQAFIDDANKFLKDNGINQLVDITGYSLGAANAQQAVAHFTGRGYNFGEVVTLNSPGISAADLASFNTNNVEKVTHYIVNSDLVSLAGQAYLPGDYQLVEWDTAGAESTFPFGDKHNTGGSEKFYLSNHLTPDDPNLPDIPQRNGVVLTSNFITKDYLSNPLFSYWAKPTEDWLSTNIVLGIISGGVIPPLLSTRSIVEASREVLGTLLAPAIELLTTNNPVNFAVTLAKRVLENPQVIGEILNSDDLRGVETWNSFDWGVFTAKTLFTNLNVGLPDVAKLLLNEFGRNTFEVAADLLNGVGAGINDVASALYYGLGRDTFEVAADLLNGAGVGINDVASALYYGLGRNTFEVAADLLNGAEAGINDVASALYYGLGRNTFEVAADLLNGAGAGINDVASALYYGLGRNTFEVAADLLNGAGAGINDVASALYYGLGRNTFEVAADLLKGAGAGINDVASALYYGLGRNTFEVAADLLKGAGAGINDVASALYYGLGRNTFEVAADLLKGAGAGINDVASALYYGLGRDTFEVAADLFNGAGAGINDVASALYYGLGRNTFEVAADLFNGAGASIYNVASALYYGLGRNTFEVAADLFNGVGASIYDVARALFYPSGLNLTFDQTVSALFNGVGGLTWLEALNIVRSI